MKKTPVDINADGDLQKEEMIASEVTGYIHKILVKPAHIKSDTLLKEGLTIFDTIETSNALNKCMKKLKQRTSN